MKLEILPHLDDPSYLEKLYRNNKLAFKKEFTTLYPGLKGKPLADFWHERLNFETDELNWGNGRELGLVLMASLCAGLLAKLPAIFSLPVEFFYSRNIGFIIFPALAAYFSWRQKLSSVKIALLAIAILIGVLYINLLPNEPQSDTLTLSCIHLIIVLWALLGFVFVGNRTNSIGRRLEYLQYNGDLVVISALICIAGAMMTGITIGLFSLIGLEIGEFYFKNFVIFFLPAVPIFGTFLIQSNPLLVGKVSPVIAKIFSPLVLVMLFIYLIAMVYSGKNPYNDREFLLIFNLLLIGVLAIIFFSVAETSKNTQNRTELWILLLLSIVTITVNCIALSAIVFRIAEWGITPNRAAVLGANLLILINLGLVTRQFLMALSGRATIQGVGHTTARYLPLYAIWALIVTFLFPFLFGFQ
ncbi:hypothetical protein KI659_17150 [Litoribacter alkaliphilus]|uniref:DUF4153 domain-containing protein n=1 Tax=Litoribacter ruber TaxID=702568 RepID=A0AAP2CNG1_9BACT|nr:hypothetical protein [Litoribacter alkaliphilus]MBS9525750.1 hypothetical protein [Litoribacter alkaliphilus]